MNYFFMLIVLTCNISLAKQSPLIDFVGSWRPIEKQDGCLGHEEIEITKNTDGSSISIKNGKVAFIVSESLSPSIQENKDIPSPDDKSTTITSYTLAKFVPPSIVTTQFWQPEKHNHWLGAGIKVWTINKNGQLVQKRTGASLGEKSGRKTLTNPIFDINDKQEVTSWTLSCIYKKAK